MKKIIIAMVALAVIISGLFVDNNTFAARDIDTDCTAQAEKLTSTTTIGRQSTIDSFVGVCTFIYREIIEDPSLSERIDCTNLDFVRNTSSLNTEAAMRGCTYGQNLALQDIEDGNLPEPEPEPEPKGEPEDGPPLDVGAVSSVNWLVANCKIYRDDDDALMTLYDCSEYPGIRDGARYCTSVMFESSAWSLMEGGPLKWFSNVKRDSDLNAGQDIAVYCYSTLAEALADYDRIINRIRREISGYLSSTCYDHNMIGWFMCPAVDMLSKVIDYLISVIIVPMLQWRIIL